MTTGTFPKDSQAVPWITKEKIVLQLVYVFHSHALNKKTFSFSGNVYSVLLMRSAEKTTEHIFILRRSRLLNSLIVLKIFSFSTTIYIQYYMHCWLGQEGPYHTDNTASRPICEVKQFREWLVLWLVTTWEVHLFFFLLFYFCRRFI